MCFKNGVFVNDPDIALDFDGIHDGEEKKNDDHPKTGAGGPCNAAHGTDALLLPAREEEAVSLHRG